MNSVLSNDAEARRFTWTDWLALAALTLLTVLVGQWQAASKSTMSENFLDGDAGVSLLVADVLVNGGKLYKNIAYPYGYLPACLHAFAAGLFGNSIATYLHYFLVLDVAAFTLLYLLARRIFRSWAAFLFVALVMLPEMIAPGVFYSGLINNVAYPLEPIFMLAIVLLWREPGWQDWRRALLIGLCLGAMQGVKFGTGLVFGASLAVVELLSWYQARFDAGMGRRLLRHNLVVLGGFLLMEGVWIAVTLANVPPAIARDVLWPFYVYKNYASYAGEFRYPRWLNLGYFVGVQMAPCVSAAASLWWLGARFFRRAGTASSTVGPPSIFSLTDPGNVDAILILLVYYLLANLFLFKNVWHYYVYVWILTLGGVYLVIQPRKIIRWAALALWAGNLALFARFNIHGPDPSLYPLTLDDGEQLWVKRERHAQITGLIDYLRAGYARVDGKNRPVVFYPLGGGYYPLFHLPHQGRPSWFMVGLIRPYDDPDMANLARSARWVVKDRKLGAPVSPDPAAWDNDPGGVSHIFDAPTRVEIASRLICEKFIAPDCYVFTQRQPGAGSTHPEVGEADSPHPGNSSP